MNNPIAVSYWTRDAENIKKWVEALIAVNSKWRMTAYHELFDIGKTVYMFRVEPVPSKNERRYLKEHGLDHEFFIYKKGEE